MLSTCIIIEDQPPAQHILQKYIEDIGSLELLATFNTALDAIPFLKQHNVDLIFLDIHLPKISGIEFLKSLQNSPQVILTTAFSDYALESYEYNVIDYLLKPFSFQRFVQAISKAKSNMASPTKQQNSAAVQEDLSFYIKSGYDLIKVNSKSILYIHSDTDYTEIVTADKKHLSSDSLKTWLQKLASSFTQVHKSYLVNTNKIQKISGNQVYLENDVVIPIGRAYKNFLKNLS